MASVDLQRSGALRIDRAFGAGVLSARHGYALAVPIDGRRALAVWWLALGLLALVAAGILSILLVVSRTPGLQNAFPVADFFRVALVVHVDLSVLVWFLAFGLAAAGTAAIALSPFFGQGRPVMANYIPVLRDPWFFTGLVAFAAGVALLVLRGMSTAPAVGIRLDGAGALRFGLSASLVSAAVALIAFGWSYHGVPASLDPAAYYELLFWGGGHVLQFTWALLMMVAWLMLADAIGAQVPL